MTNDPEKVTCGKVRNALVKNARVKSAGFLALA